MKLSAPLFLLKREAKRLARRHGMPLHKALNLIATREGYGHWGLMAARTTATKPSASLYATLDDGDLVLIGARPGQGKTLMAFELALQAIHSGERAAIFTLEYTVGTVLEKLRLLGAVPADLSDWLLLDCSERINASYIIESAAAMPRSSVIVVDYLQLLDQRRDDPPLSEQIKALKDFAHERGLIMIFVSQVTRTYEGSGKHHPDITDIRLPNPLDVSLFDQACFLQDGKVHFGQCDNR